MIDDPDDDNYAPTILIEMHEDVAAVTASAPVRIVWFIDGEFSGDEWAKVDTDFMIDTLIMAHRAQATEPDQSDSADGPEQTVDNGQEANS